MTFNPNIPAPNDLLSVSQGQILANFTSSDNSFGVDHYKFSNLTSSNGFHNKVTTPVFVDTPATGLPPVTTTNPIFYGFQDSANLGVLQYSRGPGDAVPTPVTFKQSPSTPLTIAASGGTINVLNFTGLTQAYAMAYATDSKTVSGDPVFAMYFVSWTGTILTAFNLAGLVLQFEASGSFLNLKNNASIALNNVYWTLQFLRTS